MFEFLLAIVAHLFNLNTPLILSEKGIRDETTIVFQKISVIASDIVYYYAAYKLCQHVSQVSGRNSIKGKTENDTREKGETKPDGQSLIDAIYQPDKSSGIVMLLLLQPGLFMVDHIHFQYNGLLSGVFLLVMANIIEGKYITASFWFATLLNMKHIYLYCAPAIGMYLLASYCLCKSNDGSYRLRGFVRKTSLLGATVLLVFAITYAPFADVRSLKQILVRLFPFKRGLTHAYWAPNFWSLYNLADKVLATAFKDSLQVRFDIDSISRGKSISSTSGLVQEYEHLFLPSITPLTTLLLVGLLTIPLIIKFICNIGRKSSGLFIRGVTVASFTAFMFGWHVHEKAIIIVLLPLILIAFENPNLNQIFLRLTLAGTYSLFPLLYKPAEYPVKATILIAYYSYARSISASLARQPGHSTPKKTILQWIYSFLNHAFVFGIILIEFYNLVLHNRFKTHKYDFLPLMLTSSFSALGITTGYLELYLNFIYFSADGAAPTLAA